MANSVIKTKLVDGASKAVYFVYLEGDGSGEFVNYELFDPQVDFTPSPDRVDNQVTLLQIWHSFAYFDAFLSFDALVPAPSCVLTRDTVNYTDFRYFGGLKDQTTTDHTGKLLLTTNGLGEAGTKGTMIIEFRKN